jgi:hypothetical protein
MGVASSRDIARIKRDLSALRACFGESVDGPVQWSDVKSVEGHSALNTLHNSIQHLQSAKRNATPQCSAAMVPWRASCGQQRQRQRANARRVSISPEPPTDILSAIFHRATVVVSATPGAATACAHTLLSSRDSSPKEDIFMGDESTLQDCETSHWWPSSLDHDVQASRVWPHPRAPKSAEAPAVSSAPMDMCACDLSQDSDISFDICEILTTGSSTGTRKVERDTKILDEVRLGHELYSLGASVN